MPRFQIGDEVILSSNYWVFRAEVIRVDNGYYEAQVRILETLATHPNHTGTRDYYNGRLMHGTSRELQLAKPSIRSAIRKHTGG